MTRPTPESEQPAQPGAEPQRGRTPAAEAARAVQEFYGRHESFFTSYAADASLSVHPSPAGFDTFAIDLDQGALFVHPGYFTEQGYSEAMAVNSTLHEIEHFKELRDFLNERDGAVQWKLHRDRVRSSQRLKLLDNVWDDVRVDRGILAHAPAQREVQEALYHEKLWPTADMTDKPRHLQFAYTLFRESMLPDEPCTVAPDVRAELDALRAIRSRSGVSMLDYASRPDLPPSLRVRLQRKYLEPVFEKLFQADAQERQGQQAQAGQGEGQPGQPGERQLTSAELEQLFAAEYAEYFGKNPDGALPEAQVDAAVDQHLATKQAARNEQAERERAYAAASEVSVQDLRSYQQFWSELEQLENPETNRPVVEELREIFRRILTERLERRVRPKLPAAEGGLLSRPAEAVAAIRAGLLEPEVWETTEVKQRPAELVGAFDVTLVFDRSGSMDESDEAGAVKKVEQRKAGMLALEALTEFSEDLESKRADLGQGLQVRTEARAFGGEAEVEVLKELSASLSEKERVAVFKKLASTPGQHTYDFLTLELLERSLSAEDREAIAAGKLRKLVIVMSDGDSSNESRLQAAVERLRAAGVIVAGIGITEAGAAVEQAYAPDGRVARRADALAAALAAVLEQHLQTINAPIAGR